MRDGKKQGEICFIIYIAGERKLLFFIYDVIVKQFFKKRPANHYYTLTHMCVNQGQYTCK